MKNELKSVQKLIDVSTVIIANPFLSVKDFGMRKDKQSNTLIWSGHVSATAINTASSLTKTLMDSQLIGAGVILTSTTLGGIGYASLIGISATAAGASTIPIIGWVAAASLIATYGLIRYNKAKREQLEKERMYKMIIVKLQAAQAKQQQIIRKLEELLREQKKQNSNNEQKIKELEEQIANLMEIIEILKKQSENFKKAS